jgi:carboxymethylenebutenolidase
MTIGPIGREGVDIEYEPIARAGDGSVVSAYLAKPAANVGRGIVVISDEWGLTDFIRDVCDRLAREGFVALAPDLFQGRTAEDVDAAERLSKEVDLDVVDADLESAVAELFNQDATAGSKVGVIGFALGGSLALRLSSRQRRIGAVVDLDGDRLERVEELERVAAPVLAVLAGADEAASESARAILQSRLEQANATIEVRGGVRGGYMNDTRPDVHDAVAAAATWDALLAFFHSQLA